MERRNLLERLPGCVPPSPRVAVCANRRSRKAVVSCSVHKIGCLSCFSVYTGIPKGREKEWTCSSDSEQQREPASFFRIPYVGCQQKIWSKLKLYVPTLKIILDVDCSTSDGLVKKNTKNKNK